MNSRLQVLMFRDKDIVKEVDLFFLVPSDSEKLIGTWRPGLQTSQLRPISGRSQFEVSEESLFTDVPHVGRQHRQHLLVGPAVLRPPGNGVNGKRMPQILQTRGQWTVRPEDARSPWEPAKGWPQHEVR